jgi:hypothetical protein
MHFWLMSTAKRSDDSSLGLAVERPALIWLFIIGSGYDQSPTTPTLMAGAFNLSTATTAGLLAAEGDHRIDTRRSSGRQIARNEHHS